MDRYLFDTNVLLDLLTADRQWVSWSLQPFTEAAGGYFPDLRIISPGSSETAI